MGRALLFVGGRVPALGIQEISMLWGVPPMRPKVAAA